MKIEDALDKYLEKVYVTLSYGTYDHDYRKVQQLKRHLSGYNIDEIGQSEVIRYLRDRKSEREKLENATLNKEIGILKRAIYYSSGRELRFQKLRETKKLKNTISDSDMNRVLNYLRRHMKGYPEALRNLVLFKLILDTGLRISELLSLRVNDIDFLNNTIHQKHSKTRQERYVFFSESTKKLLQKLIVAHRLDDYIFISYKAKKRMTVSMVETVCSRLKKRLGLKHSISPHMWRHTFATNFLRKGGDLETLRLILGHSSIKTTQIYLHFDKEHLRKEYFKIIDNQ